MTDSIVLVTSSFPIRADGSEAAGSFVVDLVEELSKSIAVRVVAPGAAVSRERWSKQVDVFRYAAPAQPLSTLKPWRLSDVRWIVRVLRGGLAATQAALTDGTPSHVLALWGLPCGEWARRAARKAGIPYSVWLLGSDVWSLGRIPLLRSGLARVIRDARYAYADGYKLVDAAKAIAGTSVEFLPSTRRIDTTSPPSVRDRPPYRLLYLGRWHPNKGVDILLDALAVLDDADWRAIERVEIQGGGPLERLVRERVMALRVAGRPVEAGGFLTKPEAEAAIGRADWVLIPSRVESIPVVFSDAMKLGRPVVATPVGDLPTLVSDGCGVLCDGVGPVPVAAALRMALHGDGVRYEAGVMQARASQFSLPVVANRIVHSVRGDCTNA